MIGPWSLPAGQAKTSVSTWFSLGRFVALLALLLFVMFPGIFLGAETFFSRDFGIYSYPLAHYHRESLWRGEIPLWNPLNNCGLPFLAQWNTMVLYPPALFYLLLPPAWSVGVFCLLHLLLGGVGMYTLAGHWTGNRLAAAVAGVAFAFNGFSWHALMWTNTVAALAWMPLVVGMVERAWSEGGRRLVVGALVGGLQMLTGAVEIIMLTWLVVGLCWAQEGCCWRLKRPVLRVNWGTARRVLVLLLLVAGLAAAQLLPFLDLLAHSQRRVGYADSDWSMPGLGWANLLVPLFYCYRSFHGVFVQHGQYWTTSYYLGTGLLALALVGAWRVRERRVWLLAGLSGVGLILALGNNGYLYQWLRESLPVFGLMRFPVKFVILVVFAVPLLAAYGVRELTLEPRREGWRSLAVVALGLLVLTGCILWCAHQYPMPKDDWPATWRNGLSRAAFLLLIAGVVLALSRVEKTWGQGVLSLGLLLLLWLDVRTHAPNLHPTVPRQVYEPGLVRAQVRFDPAPAHGTSRVMVTPTSLAVMRHTALPSPTQDYLGRRLALFGNCNLLDGIPKLNGFYPLQPREMDNVVSLFYPGPEVSAPGLVRFLNISHKTAPGSLMDWVACAPTVPLVTAGQKPVFVSATEALARLHEPQFDPENVVYLPQEARGVTAAVGRTPARVLSSRFAAHRVEVEVEAPKPSMVVIAQSYHHAWQALVDGEPTRLWSANYAFQAVQVPGGRHVVRLVYRDRFFQVGAILSGLTILVCGLLWILPSVAGRSVCGIGAR